MTNQLARLLIMTIDKISPIMYSLHFRFWSSNILLYCPLFVIILSDLMNQTGNWLLTQIGYKQIDFRENHNNFKMK